MTSDFEDWYRKQDFSARTCAAAYEEGYRLAASRADHLSLSIENDPLAITELLADANREREHLWKSIYNIMDALKDVVGIDAFRCSTDQLPAMIRTLQQRSESATKLAAVDPVDGSSTS